MKIRFYEHGQLAKTHYYANVRAGRAAIAEWLAKGTAYGCRS